MSDVKKVYVFIDEQGGGKRDSYESIYRWLNLFVTSCKTVNAIRPFQLSYRDFHIYVIDVAGYSENERQEFMQSLGRLVEHRPSRLYLFWNDISWKSFWEANPNLRGQVDCINCTNDDSLEQIGKILLDIED